MVLAQHLLHLDVVHSLEDAIILVPRAVLLERRAGVLVRLLLVDVVWICVVLERLLCLSLLLFTGRRLLAASGVLRGRSLTHRLRRLALLHMHMHLGSKHVELQSPLGSVVGVARVGLPATVV